MATGYNRFTERSYWDVYCYPCNKVMEFSTPPKPSNWDGWTVSDWTDIEGHYPINALSRDAREERIYHATLNSDEPKEQKRFKQSKSTTAKNDKNGQRKRLKDRLTFRPNKATQARQKGQM